MKLAGISIWHFSAVEFSVPFTGIWVGDFSSVWDGNLLPSWLMVLVGRSGQYFCKKFLTCLYVAFFLSSQFEALCFSKNYRIGTSSKYVVLHTYITYTLHTFSFVLLTDFETTVLFGHSIKNIAFPHCPVCQPEIIGDLLSSSLG